MDRRGATLEDYEQELHLKVLELKKHNRVVNESYLYKSLWNRAWDLRASAFRLDKHHVDGEPPEDGYEIESLLEDRSCVRLLEAALSDKHMAILIAAAMQHTCTADSQRLFGISPQGWHKRLGRAREEGARVLRRHA